MKNNKPQKEYGLLNRRLVEHVTAFGVAALVMGVVAYVGVLTNRGELNAARPPTIKTAIRDADERPDKVSLTLTGESFTPETTVTLGENIVTDVTYISSSALRAVAAGASIPSGGGITAKNPDGQSAVFTGAIQQVTAADKASAVDMSMVMSHMDTDFAPADLNGDGRVGLPDMAAIQGAWTW